MYQGGKRINTISNLILPLLVLIIIGYGFFKKIDIYDEFLNGIKESFKMVYNLLPTLIAMILGINLFVNTGFLNFITKLLFVPFNLINVPVEILPLAIIRPMSGSASLAYLNNIFLKYGPDSNIGLLGSVIQGSTDTTFYIISLYFASVGVKKIRYSLIVGLLADLIGIVSSIIIVKLFFNC